MSDKTVWSLNGKLGTLRDAAEALALARQHAAKRAREKKDADGRDADARRVGAAIRRQIRSEIGCVPKKVSGRRKDGERLRQFAQQIGLLSAMPAKFARNDISSFHFKLNPRGLGTYRKAGSRSYQAGEIVKAVRYILRELAREIDEGGIVSNISPDPDRIASVFAALEELEIAGGRTNANVYTTLVVSLPAELEPDERERLLVDICAPLRDRSLPFAAVLHKPDPERDQRNFHAHILYSYRPFKVGPDDWVTFSDRTLGAQNDPDFVKAFRCHAAEAMNRAMAAAGRPRRFTAEKTARTPRKESAAKLTPGQKHVQNRANRIASGEAELGWMAERRDALVHARSVLRDWLSRTVPDRHMVLAALREAAAELVARRKPSLAAAADRDTDVPVTPAEQTSVLPVSHAKPATAMPAARDAEVEVPAVPGSASAKATATMPAPAPAPVPVPVPVPVPAIGTETAAPVDSPAEPVDIVARYDKVTPVDPLPVEQPSLPVLASGDIAPTPPAPPFAPLPAITVDTPDNPQPAPTVVRKPVPVRIPLLDFSPAKDTSHAAPAKTKHEAVERAVGRIIPLYQRGDRASKSERQAASGSLAGVHRLSSIALVGKPEDGAELPLPASPSDSVGADGARSGDGVRCEGAGDRLADRGTGANEHRGADPLDEAVAVALPQPVDLPKPLMTPDAMAVFSTAAVSPAAAPEKSPVTTVPGSPDDGDRPAKTPVKPKPPDRRLPTALEAIPYLPIRPFRDCDDKGRELVRYHLKPVPDTDTSAEADVIRRARAAEAEDRIQQILAHRWQDMLAMLRDVLITSRTVAPPRINFWDLVDGDPRLREALRTAAEDREVGNVLDEARRYWGLEPIVKGGAARSSEAAAKVSSNALPSAEQPIDEAALQSAWLAARGGQGR